MTVFNGHIRAKMEVDGSVYEIRVDGGLKYQDVDSGYLLSGYDADGRGLFILLPRDMPEGQQEYDLGEQGYPEVRYVVKTNMSPLCSGVLNLTVGGDVQCEGTFDGEDERGRTFNSGSFRLEKS